MLQVLEQQTKLTKNQWKIAFAATIGDMLDFFDFGLIGFVLALELVLSFGLTQYKILVLMPVVLALVPLYLSRQTSPETSSP